MKAIFKVTGAKKDRTLVRGKANAIGMELTAASFPALVEQPIDGKTILIAYKDGEVTGVFNRLGQQYPVKAKQSKNGELWVPTVLKGFTPHGGGVYVAQLTAEGVPRAKVKSIISMTRSTKFTKPELELLESKLQVVVTDFFTFPEFNENTNNPLRERKEALANSMAGIKSKKFPQFKVAEYVVCDGVEDILPVLSDFGGGFVRKVPVIAKAETPVDKKDDTDKKPKDGKAGKKDKKAKGEKTPDAGKSVKADSEKKPKPEKKDKKTKKSKKSKK